MSVCRGMLTGWLIAAACAMGTSDLRPLVAARPLAPERAASSTEFAPTWVLVRLREPLERESADHTFDLNTGRPGLDASIAEHGVQRIDRAFTTPGAEPRFPDAFRRHGLDRTYRFHVDEGRDIRDTAARLSTVTGVEIAAPDLVASGQAVYPDDSRFPLQYGLDQTSDADADAPEGWEIATGGGVILGILDSGIDTDHQDLIGTFLAGHDFVNDDADPEDDRGHGTQVSSIAAAATDNGAGIAGVCWDCPLLPVKVTDQNGNGFISDFVSGLIWATDQGARVINFSIGHDLPSPMHLSGVNYAYDAGVVMIGSAGNGGTYGLRYPAARAEHLAIGGTNADDERAAPWSCTGSGGSRYGREIDVVAAGDAVIAADLTGGYVSVCGTSFSAPLVTGAAGLIETVLPSAGREEVRHLLRAGAEDRVGRPAEDTPGFDVHHGWGRLNLERTLLAAVSSVGLRVEGRSATRVWLDVANPVATSYDFVRGDLASLSEDWRGVDLGTLVCLEDDSPDPDTTGDEDLATPASGQAFFYLCRFTAAPGTGSYGGSSLNRDREALTLSEPRWRVEGDQAGALFGSVVAAAGDVNGDGFDDVIVAAESWDGVAADRGAAFVYTGSATGLALTPTWMVEGDQSGTLFGASVASAGDVNGDGYDEVIVGDPYSMNDDVQEGRVFVYLGSTAGPATTASWTFESDALAARAGASVASAGDVNGDGYDDVIVGAPYYDNPEIDEGRAFVFHGSALGLSASPVWTGEPDQLLAQYGSLVTSAGDVNGDGYDDVAVGAPQYDGGEGNEGRIFVYHGSASGLAGSPATILEIDIDQIQLGGAVAAAGDVDHDGYDDLIVGAQRFAQDDTEEGIAYLFSGSASGLATTPSWSYLGAQAYARLGVSVASAGDVDQDGYDDVVLGADLMDVTRSDEGQALLFLGSATGPAAAPDWLASTGWPVAQYGWRVAGAGDVNGDGKDDVVVGAPAHTHDEVSEGAVYLYLGDATGVQDPQPTTDCNR